MSKTIKMSTVAAAVSAAMFAGMTNAASFNQYNYENKQPITKQFSGIQAEATKEQTTEVTTFLIKLKSPSIAEQAIAGNSVSYASSNIEQSQQAIEEAIFDLGAELQIVTKTSKLVNAIVVNGRKETVELLASNPLVEAILPVYDYKLDVAESADYIKATPLVQAGTATGQGIRVAVLDTGVDYTHKAFGGSGLVEDYEAAAADPTDTPAWPQGQIVGGYDFYNNDPDPIDAGTNHGTHVSHSVTGIAPNVELFVYSVCAGGCPGVAQLRALEAAMDPNGDGDISDRVDVINMSLGGDFGDSRGGAVQELIDKAVKLGTTVVISAGNDGPTPFIVGGPSTTQNALSVGAMTHPVIKSSVVTNEFLGAAIDVGVSSFNPVEEFAFSSDTTPLVFLATEQNANKEDTSVACAPFANDVDFTGKAVLVDRGACAFVTKVENAQARGAAFVIIANHTPEAGAIRPGGGSDKITIPSIGISYEDGKALKAAIASGNASYSVVSELKDQKGAIASFTSRGPSMDGILKPEITAPGVNIMTAHPGLGDGLTPASGTSFSGPITAGAMSMLREALPQRNALEAKATIMNTANLDVTMEPRGVNPDAALAPISYIGAGLVDMEKAVSLPVAAWAKDTKQAALSFGLVSMSETTSYVKTVEVKNFSNDAQTYSLSLEQRFADDIERGALVMDFPATITVPAGQTVSFDVTATINPAKLPEWTLNSSNMYKPETSADLTRQELDGALNFSKDGQKAFHLVYHVLPKATSAASIMPMKDENGAKHILTNTGAVALDPFFAPTTAVDPAGDSERLDIIGASVETISVPADYCASGYMTFTTFVTEKPISHTYQGGFMADIDFPAKGETAPNGTFDVTIQNGKLEWFGDYPSGSAITFTHGYGSTRGSITDLYFTSGNNYVTLSSCIESLGLDAASLAAGVQAKIRFRTEEETWNPVPSNSLDSVMVDYTFKPASGNVAALVDESGNPLSEALAPGASARIAFANDDFMMLSSNGATPFVATPESDSNDAPIVTLGQSFSVDENTINATVLGEVAVTYASTLANPVSEFIVTNSTSTAITVTSKGQVVVVNSAQLDYDAGLTKVELEVVAVDAAGNVSEPAMVTVNVNNLADEPIEQPAPVVTADQTFSVDENTATDTEIGSVAYTTTNPFAQFMVKSSTSEAITVTASGKVVVADSELLDFDAGVESVTLTVVAVDEAGLESDPVEIVVSVNNLADEASEQPAPVTPVEPPKKKSSGSMFWMLLAAPLALFRRRK
ncbi:Serine protease, subtilase family [Pseudoalteromonas luteoviolacea B = ATCC 29581]|nr:Serine protease, subtilase family [Pseudoalteromonas luteoviolacea B = ATCC 29581]